ncbi:MAG: cytochrome P450 [Microthrixaceae bacterium]
MDDASADRLLATTVLDDEGRQDPTVAYRRFLAELPRWRSATGATVLTRYHDSLSVLRSPRWGRYEADMGPVRGIGGHELGRGADVPSMLLMNPPDHTRVRGLVAREFTPRRVDSLRPRIASLLEPLLDDLAGRTDVDLLTVLAVPFPVAVISALLGVPHHRDSHFIALVRALTSFIEAGSDQDAIDRAEAAAIEVAAYFVDLVEEKRSEPDDGLLSALIEVEAEGDRLSSEELIVNTILLYAAGFETTSNLIGNGMLALLTHSDELDRLREPGPDRLRRVGDVALRLAGPTQRTLRTRCGPPLRRTRRARRAGDSPAGCGEPRPRCVRPARTVRGRSLHRHLGTAPVEFRMGSAPLPGRTPGTRRGGTRVLAVARPIRAHRDPRSTAAIPGEFHAARTRTAQPSAPLTDRRASEEVSNLRSCVR